MVASAVRAITPGLSLPGARRQFLFRQLTAVGAGPLHLEALKSQFVTEPGPSVLAVPGVPVASGPSLMGGPTLGGSRARTTSSRPAARSHATARTAPAPSPFQLSEEQQGELEKQGFLVLPGFASASECRALQARMAELVAGFDPATVSIFSTRNQTAETNEYFLHSGGNISFFFEENAFDAEGQLKQPKALSINKVGHALHDLDPVFRSFSRSPKMAALARDLGYSSPVPVQSMYIFKQPGIGGEVVPHQDSAFLHTSPLSCTGLWLAVEDATRENGCLWALPGSHRDPLVRRFVKTDKGGVTFDSPTVPEYDVSQFVPLEAAQGTLVVLHGQLVHFSYENRSPKSRHAYTVHVIESDGCSYSPDNWLQRGPSDPPFEPLVVP